MLELVQMSKYARRKPFQLSGGQQQRVALARSPAKRPKLLLLDEPLGALDKKLRQQTQLELVNMIEQVGVTCIMVTHDQEEAMTMASRVGIMSEGQLLQVASPSEIYERPNCRFTAELLAKPICCSAARWRWTKPTMCRSTAPSCAGRFMSATASPARWACRCGCRCARAGGLSQRAGRRLQPRPGARCTTSPIWAVFDLSHPARQRQNRQGQRAAPLAR